MINEKQIETKVFEIISITLEISLKSISVKSSTQTIHKWDSLKHMNIIVALEEEFNIEFSDKQIVEMPSVKIIISNIKQLLNES